MEQTEGTEKLHAMERRNKIIELLRTESQSISGSKLAKIFGVSRQVIVTDMAILKQRRRDLISTSTGYMLLKAAKNRRIFKVKHTDEQTEDELSLIVDFGGAVLDVFVEHKVYGTITAPINISSKRDVKNFIADIKSGVSKPLMNITQGYHYHTVEARSEEILDEIQAALKERGYLIGSGNSASLYSPKIYSEL